MPNSLSTSFVVISSLSGVVSIVILPLTLERLDFKLLRYSSTAPKRFKLDN